jgi:hypothetical protein
MNIAVVNVPALSVVFGSAASEFGHGPAFTPPAGACLERRAPRAPGFPSAQHNEKTIADFTRV